MNEKKSKRNKAIILISFILAAIICAAGFFFYLKAKEREKTEAFSYAISSDDPLVLQAFLDSYPRAETTMIDAVKERLRAILQAKKDWDDACMSNSKSELLAYLEKYPDSPHRGAALDKIDSIDWEKAKRSDTEEGYREYISMHPNSPHMEDAAEMIRNLQESTLQEDERYAVSLLFQRFFDSMELANGQMMRETLADILENFQGKNNVPADKVVRFMQKLWEENPEDTKWRITDDMQIDKIPTETERAEYEVRLTARQETHNAHNSKESQTAYFISATVNSEWQIVKLNMTRIIED